MELLVPQWWVSLEMVPEVQGCCQDLNQNLGVEPSHVFDLIFIIHPLPSFWPLTAAAEGLSRHAAEQQEEDQEDQEEDQEEKLLLLS